MERPTQAETSTEKIQNLRNAAHAEFKNEQDPQFAYTRDDETYAFNLEETIDAGVHHHVEDFPIPVTLRRFHDMKNAADALTPEELAQAIELGRTWRIQQLSQHAIKTHEV